MARGGSETSRAFVEMTINIDMAELLTLEVCHVIVGMVVSKGCVVIAVCPPYFSVDEGVMFLLGQKG